MGRLRVAQRGDLGTRRRIPGIEARGALAVVGRVGDVVAVQSEHFYAGPCVCHPYGYLWLRAFITDGIIYKIHHQHSQIFRKERNHFAYSNNFT